MASVMHAELELYFPIAQAVEILLHPWAEIVIHDLKIHKIAAIYNNFSKRKIGDDSLLEETFLEKDLPPFFEPYYKTNWDGRRFKSTTATLRNGKGRPIGLFCINLDVSKADELQKLLSSFTTQISTSLPQELFSEDWREKISIYVHSYLAQNHLNLQALNRQQKRELVHLLYQEGAFKAKHAAQYVGHVLDISRATVYKYLMEVNNKSK